MEPFIVGRMGDPADGRAEPPFSGDRLGLFVRASTRPRFIISPVAVSKSIIAIDRTSPSCLLPENEIGASRMTA
jgi:hypothetical protein